MNGIIRMPLYEVFKTSSNPVNPVPNLDKYFEGFFAVQNEGVKIVKKLNPKNKFLED